LEGEYGVHLVTVERQKSQEVLASPGGGRGEAPSASGGGTEAVMTVRGTGSPESKARLMEEVCERENLKRALRRVQANKGGPGVDGMRVDELVGFLREHWPVIREQLLTGAYRPQPVRRVEIPKHGGGVRKLGIPTVIDRFVQQAILQVLQPQWDPTFSESSFGFRPGRSAHQAVEHAQCAIVEGHRWVVDIDLESFFDRVNHDILMARVAKRVEDKRVLRVLRGFLKAGVMDGGLVNPVDEGTPQGGPLSPILSNLLLDDLDRELERRGHRFVRYADDCNIYVASERAGQRVMASITDFLERKLKLRVNRSKSAVAPVAERQFLGFSFVFGRNGEVKRKIAAKALRRFVGVVRKKTRRNRKVTIKAMVEDLGTYLRGWRGYFGFCQTPSVLHELDAWIRRRLRCVVWKQWKTPAQRHRRLRALGIGVTLTHMTAGSTRGLWAMSCSKGLQIALRNASFDLLGLPRLELAL
jgi:RNA-directed DNA polymerase